MNRREFGKSVLAAASATYGLNLPSVCYAKPKRRPGLEPTPEGEPTSLAATTLYWSADHEEGNLSDWTRTATSNTAGGNFSDSGNNDKLEVVATSARAHGGRYSVRTKIKKAINLSIGTRLMRWRDLQGNLIPAEAYYSTWMYVVHNYRTVADWWIVFQFKSQRPDNRGSNPTISGNLYGDGSGYEFYFWDYTRLRSYDAGIRFKAGTWVHLEAWMKYHTTAGAIKFWQNGQLVIQQDNLKTKMTSTDLHSVWGIGNYTSSIEGHPNGPGIAEVYFDDAAISSVRRGPV